VSIRYSDSTILGTHGSPGSTLGCVTTTTITSFAIALPEITSTATLKDSFGVRVYATNSASDKIVLDADPLTGNLLYDNGTQTYNTFTEYELERQSHEPAGNATPTWGLGMLDGPGTVGITVAGGTAFPVSGSYTTSKYMEFDQTPTVNFIPAGATVTSSSISLTYYETVASGNTMCVQMDAYVNGSDAVTQGSSGASCSSSTTTESTFTISTSSAIASASAANNVYVRVTAKNSASSAQLRVDYIALSVTYSLSETGCCPPRVCLVDDYPQAAERRSSKAIPTACPRRRPTRLGHRPFEQVLQEPAALLAFAVLAAIPGDTRRSRGRGTGGRCSSSPATTRDPGVRTPRGPAPCGYPPWTAETRSGTRFAALGVPRPVIGSQPGVAG